MILGVDEIIILLQHVFIGLAFLLLFACLLLQFDKCELYVF